MAGPEYIELPELTFAAPVRRRPVVRRQRRLDPSALPEPEMLGAPGRANDSGLSEQDLSRADVQQAARDAVPTNAFGRVADDATPLPPSQQVLGDATTPLRPGIIDDDDAEEAATQGRVDHAMSTLTPAQRTQVQALPTVGHEDSRENASEIINASARAQGTPMPARKQLQTSQINIGGTGTMRTPSPYTPAPSMRLQAPMVQAPRDPLAPVVTPAAPMSEAQVFGIVPEDEEQTPVPAPVAPVAPVEAAAPVDEDDEMLGTAPAEEAAPTNRIGRVDGAYVGPASEWTPDAQTAEDNRDRTQAQRMQRARRGLAIASLIPALFGGRSGGQTGRALATIATNENLDPQRAYGRIEARRAARAQEAEAARTRTQEGEDRDWRRGLEERRIAQAESAVAQRAGYRDADVDVNHPNAAQQRVLYETEFAAVPEHIRNALPGFNPADPDVRAQLAQMSASQVRELGERMRWQIEQRYPDDRDWRNRVTTGGGRARADRGRLASEYGGGQSTSRTITRGDSGLSRAQLVDGSAEYSEDELRQHAVDQGFGGSVPPARTPEEDSAISGRSPDEVRTTRRANGQNEDTGQPLDYVPPPPRAAARTGAPATSSRPAPAPRAPRQAQAPRQAAPAQQAQATPEDAPAGRPVWDRPPTQAELDREPRMASHEALVRTFARENNLNLNDQGDRRVAAGAVDAMTPAQVGELTTRQAERTDREHAAIMREVPVRYHRREVLSSLRGRLRQATQPQILAALHGGPGMARVAGASQLRADVNDFMNNYFKETGGAAISDSEAQRYRTGLGIDSTVVDPQAFIAFITRRVNDLDAEIDTYAAQYPNGFQRYAENHRAGGRR